jgi:hypothetical protein
MKPANDNSGGFAVTMDALGYSSLARVLGRAFDQAANGKGKERHAGELPFDKQPMQTLCGLYGVGFALGQAAKKTQEAQRLPRDRAVAELLGAINYLAGAVIFLEAQPMKIDFTITPPKRQPEQYCDCTTRTGCVGQRDRDCRNIAMAYGMERAGEVAHHPA